MNYEIFWFISQIYFVIKNEVCYMKIANSQVITSKQSIKIIAEKY